jgi:hypothetical protein
MLQSKKGIEEKEEEVVEVEVVDRATKMNEIMIGIVIEMRDTEIGTLD